MQIWCISNLVFLVIIKIQQTRETADVIKIFRRKSNHTTVDLVLSDWDIVVKSVSADFHIQHNVICGHVRSLSY